MSLLGHVLGVATSLEDVVVLVVRGNLLDVLDTKLIFLHRCLTRIARVSPRDSAHRAVLQFFESPDDVLQYFASGRKKGRQSKTSVHTCSGMSPK